MIMSLLTNNFKKIFIFASLFGFLAFAAAPAAALPFDSAKSEACKAAQLSGSAPADCANEGQRKLSETIRNGINLLSVVVGVIAVIVIIVGGLRYILAEGDSQKVNTARSTILYALIGLILVAFAQIIVRFVVGRL